MKDSPRIDPHSNFVVQLDEEVFAFEAQLADLCPAEGVDFGVSLKPTKVPLYVFQIYAHERPSEKISCIPERPGLPSV